MEIIFAGLQQAIYLILAFDRELYSIIFLSLKVSGSALLLAALIGLPIGSLIGLKRFLEGILSSASSTHSWAYRLLLLVLSFI